MLVAEIFTQLNDIISILIQRSAFTHHHCVLLLYWTDLYIVAVIWLVMLKARWQPSSCGSHTRGRTEMSLVTETPSRGGQQLPGEYGQGWGILLMHAGRGQISQVPAMGAQLQALSASAWRGWCLNRYLQVPEESSLQRKRACADSMAQEGMESPQDLP